MLDISFTKSVYHQDSTSSSPEEIMDRFSEHKICAWLKVCFLFHSLVRVFPWFCYPGFLILWLCDLGSNIRLISGLFTPTGPSESGPRPKEDISLERKKEGKIFQKIQNAQKRRSGKIQDTQSRYQVQSIIKRRTSKWFWGYMWKIR